MTGLRMVRWAARAGFILGIAYGVHEFAYFRTVGWAGAVAGMAFGWGLMEMIARGVIAMGDQRALHKLADRIAAGEVEGTFGVYLRPFQEDFYVDQVGAMKRGLLSEDIEALERVNPQPLGAFLVDMFGNEVPIVGLGREAKSYFVKGPGLTKTDDDSWQDIITDMLDRASVIFIVPSHREGTLWEVNRLAERPEWLEKTVFMMPHFDAQVAHAVKHASRKWSVAKFVLAMANKVGRRSNSPLSTQLRVANIAALRQFIFSWRYASVARRTEKRLTKSWNKAREACAEVNVALPEFHHRGEVFAFATAETREQLYTLDDVDPSALSGVLKEWMSRVWETRRERETVEPIADVPPDLDQVRPDAVVANADYIARGAPMRRPRQFTR